VATGIIAATQHQGKISDGSASSQGRTSFRYRLGGDSGILWATWRPEPRGKGYCANAWSISFRDGPPEHPGDVFVIRYPNAQPRSVCVVDDVGVHPVSRTRAKTIGPAPAVGS
jgi:hypothetical protein